MDNDIEDTEIKFDLASELSAEEITKFRESANGKPLTEHFLDVTIRNKEDAA